MRRPLRVLIATDAFPPVCGGSGWSTFELARGLRRAGHDVLVLQPRPGRRRGVVERSHDGMTVLEAHSYAPALPFLRNYFKNERLYGQFGQVVADLARQHRADVIHGQHVLSGPAAVVAGDLSARPTVCTVRDYWPLCYWADLIHDPSADGLCPACTAANMTRCLRPRARAWPLALPMIPYMRGNLARKRRALASARAVVAVSSAIADDLRARAPELAHARVEVIPNPVDLASIRQSASALPRPLDAPYVVFAGKLEVNKGIRHLVPGVAAAGLDLPVIVAGDGSQRGALERQAREARLDLRVLGWRPREEVLAWLRHARFVLFPSHGPESLSRVLLEAGALGVPAVAMDTGGTRDIVVHGQTGLLAAGPEAWAREIGRLAGDDRLRAALGASVTAHVETHFAADHVVARTVALYGELLAEEETRANG
jgi:glycosyltransferase involved in cell wall biosynthesis